MLHHIYNSTLALLQKMSKGNFLNLQEKKDVENIPYILMICFLNEFEEAKQKLIDAKLLLKQYENPEVYIAFKEVLRVLRKMKYNKNE